MKASLPYSRRLVLGLVLSIMASLIAGGRPLRAQPTHPGSEATKRPVNPAFVQNGPGELEIAVSEDGQNVVIAANGGYSFSSTPVRSSPLGGQLAVLAASVSTKGATVILRSL
jgi:hypothetical protein